MFLFYKYDLMIASNEGGWDFVLDGQEAKHIINVLRMNISDKIKVTNGRGYFVDAEIVSTTKKECKLLALNVEKVKQKDYHLHIAVAPTKNISRFEWFLEKAVEMGIDEITPLVCRNSIRKTFKIDRAERVIISAMKQSFKAWKPILNELTDYDYFIEKNQLSQKFIAHYEGVEQEKLIKAAEKGNDTLVLIGPEGDFDPKEVELAKENNFKSVSLSDSRLRTETAALAANFAINLLNQ